MYASDEQTTQPGRLVCSSVRVYVDAAPEAAAEQVLTSLARTRATAALTGSKLSNDNPMREVDSPGRREGCPYSLIRKAKPDLSELGRPSAWPA